MKELIYKILSSFGGKQDHLKDLDEIVKLGQFSELTHIWFISS
ncbi:hypothetical protein predicted by Glimmer/Critica [Bdellovibrio bacteriovorus HD100]|uniref:Uncharacterized protein n=1 Tax=Bdellovibrio bacteriovorus (strain ATCC 15356 / DSM 50701 / NCIMB 9529 / HD100) TaxID=264462 RepID=Q6MQ25_BDEBA|nr:hypothetical protein predicted by Glimmer/Critica [Bdellovibrio bacteriovorus HD100]